jgi:hypothetical protein
VRRRAPGDAVARNVTLRKRAPDHTHDVHPDPPAARLLKLGLQRRSRGSQARREAAKLAWKPAEQVRRLVKSRAARTRSKVPAMSLATHSKSS